MSEAPKQFELKDERGKMARAIDGAIAEVFPGWGRRRAAARLRTQWDSAMAAYQAAEMNRVMGDWPSAHSAGATELLTDMQSINDRARAARRDDWAAASICNSFKRDVVGTGITPRAIIQDGTPPKPLKELNADLDWLWKVWSRRSRWVDRERRQTLAMMLRLVVDDWVQTGNAFVLMGYERRMAAVGLVLQMFEVEQLASELTQERSTGNEIRGGVEVDEAGAPVAYHVYLAGHPLEQVNRDGPARIPAERVLAFGQPTRVRQILSPSQLASVLSMMRERQNWDAYERRSKIIEACIALQLVTQQGSVPPTSIGLAENTGASLTDQKGNTINRMESGLIFKPPAGTELKLLNPQRPGPIYDSYMERQVSMIAAGADRSSSTVGRKYTASYTAERRGLIEDEKVTDYLQEDLINLVLQPIWERFVTLAILEGRVEVPARFLRDEEAMQELFEVAWQPPGKPPIDDARSAAANKIDLDYKLNNRGAIIATRGRNWRDNFEDIAEQRDMAEEKEIPLPEFAAAPAVSASEPRPRGQSNAPSGTADEDEAGARIAAAIIAEAITDET